MRPALPHSFLPHPPDVVLTPFPRRLAVTLAAQAEPTATGEYVDLTDQVRASKSAQFQAEHDLRAYRRSVQSDLEAKVRVEEENAQLRELCRRHGLLV